MILIEEGKKSKTDVLKDFFNRNKRNKAICVLVLTSVLFLVVAVVVFAVRPAEDEKIFVDEVESPTVEIEPPVQNTEPTPEPPQPAHPIEEDNDEEVQEQFINNLTGLVISEEAARRRPFAVMINNHRSALPQSGIGQADIYYEVLAEGDITRFVVLLKEFDTQKLGPVRSTRDYYGLISMDNDAFFIHHGGSDGGYIFIKTHKLDAIDGMRDAKTFWRDRERPDGSLRAVEHSSYTSAERLFAAVEEREFRMEYAEEYEYVNFDFYDELTVPKNGEAIKSVTVPFSHSQKPEFVYDEENGVFMRFQAGGEHIDDQTGEQIYVSNVIIQFATMRVIDNAGRRQIDLVAGGDGYLATGGAYVPITWEKESITSATRFYDEDGMSLRLNKGKTWICIILPSADVLFE